MVKPEVYVYEVSNHELTSMEYIVSADSINPSTTSNRYKNILSIPVNSRYYSQVAPMHERGPSMTSTPMVKQAGGTVDPQVEVRNTHKEQEYVDWKHQFQTLGNAIITQTNEVLLKTLNEHEKFQKRSKDLLDEEMADLRRKLDSLKPSIDDDAVIPKKIIVAAPVYDDIPNPPTMHVGRSMSDPHASGMDNYKWIIDQNGQPIYVPSHTEGNSINSSVISRISRKV